MMNRLEVAPLRSREWTPVIALAHALVATILAEVLNIWIDEGYTLDTTSRTIAYAWSQAISFESQPPFYFLLMTLWRRICDTVFFARLFSVCCTTATILLAPYLSKLFLGSNVRPRLLPALIAAHPLTLFAAVEMRRYALVLMLTSCLLIAFDKAFGESNHALAYWKLLYPLLALVSLYTDYFIGFVLAAQSVLLVTKRRWRGLIVQIAGMSVVAALSVPLLSPLLSQLATYEVHEASSMSQLARAQRYLSYSLDNLLWTQWFGPLNRPAKLLLLAAAAYCVARLLRKARTARGPSLPGGPVVLTVTIVGSLIVASLVFAPSILQPKHLIVLLVPMNLAFLALLTSFRKELLAVAVVGFAAINLLGCIHNFGHLAKRGDCKRVARFIQERERPNEPIVVFNAEAALGFEEYYRGLNALAIVPRPIGFRNYNLRDLALKDEREFWASLSRLPVMPTNIWVLTDSATDPDAVVCGYGDIDFNCKLFESILSRHFVLIDQERFFESRVRYFRRSTN
jgi:hypothetical protein